MPRMEETLGLPDGNYGPNKKKDIPIRILKIEDFLNMPTTDLIGWWIYSQSEHKAGTHDPEDYAKWIASYDAYGREAVAGMLSEYKYSTDQEESKIIRLQDLKGILTKMKTGQDARLFSIEFVKRSDGHLRKMLCRYGVTKYLRGGEKAFEDKDHDLSTVYDIEAAPTYNKEEKDKIAAGLMEPRPKGGYRSIALESIIRATIGGQKYVVEENKDKVSLLKD